MTGKSQSILLQVAFKESAAQGGTVGEIEARTVQFYESLVSLHQRLGINAEDTGPKRGNSGGGGASGSKPAVTGPEFQYNGVTFIDFTAAKETNAVAPRFPDFKTKDGSEMPGITNDKGAVWLTDQEGNAKPELADIADAAKAAAPLI